VTADANPGADPSAADDEAALARYGAELAAGVVRALPGWVVRCVVGRAEAWQPGRGEPLVAAAEEAGRQAAREQGAAVVALLATDVDDQATGPLAIVRTAVVHPTRVLAGAGVPAVERDEFAERAFPDDVYDLAPASFADLDPELHEPGIVWGAAKAHVILRRRRRP
jgi:hypothetical protein